MFATDFQMVKMYGYLDPSKVADPLMKSNMEFINSKYSPSGLYNDLDVQNDTG